MPRNPAKPLTLEEAYQAAFLWFDHKGEPPQDISEPAHGSIQVTTETTLARVRVGATPADQSSVLALLRADPGNKKLAIFSTTGFTPGAISVAETQGMALYELDSFGHALAKTTHARSLAPETDPPAPFAPEKQDSDPAWADQRLPGQDRPLPDTPPSPPGEADTGVAESERSYVIPPPDHPTPADPAPAIGTPVASPAPPVPTTPASGLAPKAATPAADQAPIGSELSPSGEDDWAECPTCGTSHFRNARFCRSCGTNLITGRPHGHSVTTDGTELVCNTCGGTDIAAIAQHGPS